MSVSVLQSSPDVTVLRIDGDLTIHGIQAVRDAIPPLNTIRAMQLELADIGEIDFSGLQLLLALQKCVPLKILSVSPSVMTMARLFQVDSWFDLPPETPPEP